MDTEFSLHQPILDGRYVVEDAIGRSASGAIYRVHGRPDNIPRALLVVNKAGAKTRTVDFYRNLFYRATTLAGRLTHPHIAHVVEYAEDEQYLYLVGEYAAGGSLRERLQQGPLPWPEAVRITLEVAAALEALHTQLRAVHRDVKPGNIIFDEQGRALLTGLGLAQVAGEEARAGRFRRHLGGPEYMSPEQAGTDDYLSPSANVYSLGCILFEMLTGRLWKEVRRAVQGPRELDPKIPEWLDQAVQRMLREEPGLLKADAADPHKRFVDMAAVRQALVATGPTPAAPPERPAAPIAPAAPPERPAAPIAPAMPPERPAVPPARALPPPAFRAPARGLLLVGAAVLLVGLVMLGAWAVTDGVLGIVDDMPICAEPPPLALVRVAVGLGGLIAAGGLWRGRRWGRALGLFFALTVAILGLVIAVLIVTQVAASPQAHYFANFIWAETLLALAGLSGGIVLASRLEQPAVFQSLGQTAPRPAGLWPIAAPLMLTVVGLLPASGLLRGRRKSRRIVIVLLLLFAVLVGLTAFGLGATVRTKICGCTQGEYLCSWPPVEQDIVYECSAPIPSPWGSALVVTAGLVIVAWSIAAVLHLVSDGVLAWFREGEARD